MKKIGILLILILTFSLLQPLVSSQDDSGIPPEVKGITDTSERITGIGKNLSDEEKRDAYLKQEWSKILEKSNAGKVILRVGKVFEALSPVSKIFIGIEYSLSWIFFLSLAFWIAIVIIIYKPIKNFIQADAWVPWAISIIVPTLGSQFGALQMVVSFFAPLFQNLWSTITTLIVLGILIYAYSAVLKHFGLSIEKSLKEEREERREQKAKTVERIHDITIKSSK